MQRARQVLIEGWNQEAIGRVHASVIGCGALGSQVACSLARLGVGRVTLIDPDVLEEHNLENQVYDAGDIGKLKVSALKQRIAAIDPTIDVRTWRGHIQDYRGAWVPYVFGCLDNVAARHYLSYEAVAKGNILIDGGIERFRGAVKTIIPRKTACQACYPMLPRAAPTASCSHDPIPSTYVTASIVANLQVAQLIKLVHGQHPRSYVAIDLARGTWQNYDFEPSPDCEMCSLGAN